MKNNLKREVKYFRKIITGETEIENVGKMSNLIARWQTLYNYNYKG